MGRGRVGGGGQGGCERRIEVFVKIQKNIARVGLGGGQGGCERREFKFFCENSKKNRVGGGGGGGAGVGLGVRVDVNGEVKIL